MAENYIVSLTLDTSDIGDIVSYVKSCQENTSGVLVCELYSQKQLSWNQIEFLLLELYSRISNYPLVIFLIPSLHCP